MLYSCLQTIIGRQQMYNIAPTSFFPLPEHKGHLCLLVGFIDCGRYIASRMLGTEEMDNTYFVSAWTLSLLAGHAVHTNVHLVLCIMYPRSTVPMTRETSVQTQALHFPTRPTLSLCVQWSWKAAWAGAGAASPSPTQLSSKTWSSVGGTAAWASRPLQPPRPVRSSGMIEEWFRITTNFVQRQTAFPWKITPLKGRVNSPHIAREDQGRARGIT